MHRLTSVTDPLERKTTYAYDAEGNVTGKTTPRGTTGYTTRAVCSPRSTTRTPPPTRRSATTTPAV
ncbi:RHS repeat domain-containing protein [Streptomyces calvus]|uniref:RHS repeat domain-containing protein n=1 Tax=Streptomyces calvus TaxID=67282 RepID=UPI00371BE6AE